MRWKHEPPERPLTQVEQLKCELIERRITQATERRPPELRHRLDGVSAEAMGFLSAAWGAAPAWFYPACFAAGFAVVWSAGWILKWLLAAYT